MSVRVSTSSPLKVGLLRAHVLAGVPMSWLVLGEEGLVGELLCSRLGDAEVDHLGTGLPSLRA